MKKILSLVLALAMVLTVMVAGAEGMKIGMITDSGDITDQSFNQTTWEACVAWGEANGVEYTYYKPVQATNAERVAMAEAAIDDGCNVIVMPGYLFGEAIAEIQGEYPEITFIALDVSEGDVGGEVNSNVFCAVYQEELAGYMAGYAAVKLGYKQLGFLGGMAVPAVIRYGYGYVQGADAAAKELGLTDVAVKYVYGNQFYGDADITAYMDTWYQNGTEVVFACGGGIYSSAAEAAAKVGGKVIGVDVDQAAIIDVYGEGMTVTSAMKGLAATVNSLLTEVQAGNFANYGGKVECLGLVSAVPAENYVQLGGSTQWADSFTVADYEALVAAMFNGEITVSNAIDADPAVEAIAFENFGNIK